MSNQILTIIGAGNVAWHLAPALENAGVLIRSVYSRSPENADALTNRLYQAEVAADLDFSNSDASVFLLAVSDKSIEMISREIILPADAVLAHTSATVPVNTLEFAGSDNYGIFYPLQTFSKSKKIDIRNIPVLIEGSNRKTEETLVALARTISGNVVKMDGENRKILHLAAVFANNFTNHMVKIAEDILHAHGADLSLLLPLLHETVEKIVAIGPEAAQTGPAVRKDDRTILRHLELLKDSPELYDIYALLSRHIEVTYSDNNE